MFVHIRIEHSQTANMGTTQSQNSEIENGNEVEVVKLPYNCNTILREADSSSPADLQQLYHQLCDGVYLNHKKKKYWVEKKSNTNCFLLFARDLLITWDDDDRFWHWYCPSNEMIEVSELLNICWLEIHGNFDTRNLSPNILYEAAFMVMLKDPAYGWEVPVNLRLTLPNGTKQQHKQNLAEKPRGQWIEIPAGEFFTSPENVGPMEISLYEYEGGKWKRGLVIKGIIIRPKNYALNIDP
ncbi:lectin-like [Mercurialis annua]|uniref:lectin-like n=1 Tax=Mercurialis annua TaxID=3986 RepID=UPI00215ED0F9|nr:lectin-like [Mercurialis annua]